MCGSQQTSLFAGARYDGVFGMWYGKGPGVDRSMDVIKHANAFGTSKYGGVLAVAGDDHACKSSTLPHQSEHMFIGASVPVLSPANVQEVLDLGVFGWELSRYSGCWVALKAITENMDSAISADIDPERDRKSTRLNSSHDQISYAVFCLKKKKMPGVLVKHKRNASTGDMVDSVSEGGAVSIM